MQKLGLNINIENIPEYDKDFTPAFAFYRAYKKSAEESGAKKIAIGIQRDEDNISVFETVIHNDAEWQEMDKFYIERLVKSLLWMWGGSTIYIFGDEKIAEYIRRQYTPEGNRHFDYAFMNQVYGRPIEIKSLQYSEKKNNKQNGINAAKKLNGYRIGFDAGGSDMKVCAVADGEVLYSDEIVWNPKVNNDPEYHYKNISDAIEKAASYLPEVEAIGISSAGVYLDNQCKAASLFIKLSKEDFAEKAKDIYINLTAKYNKAKVVVMNDGDVAAVAGAIGLDENGVMGIAMGTSQAAGFIDINGEIKGWLNELAFVPIDYNEKAMQDEWSLDIGCGVKYFSQDGVIKLAEAAGIEINTDSTPAQKLKYVQKLLSEGDNRARKVFESIGIYLGHTLPYYHMFYKMKHVLLMGRVMSGAGGEIILETSKNVLKEEYPKEFEALNIQLPDEKTRRIGQSVAAASIPEI